MSWAILSTQIPYFRPLVSMLGYLETKGLVCSGCVGFCKFLKLVLVYWIDCLVRGFQSCSRLGSASLLVIMWSCFLSLTSMSCLLYVLLSKYLGYTPGLFIVGLLGILVLWMYTNFWIIGTLFIVGGYLFSLSHARLIVLIATAYSVKVRVGWIGVFLSINLTIQFFEKNLTMPHEYP
ncbi:hypothetical protein E1A91_D05G397000v1 [Gossypium mustelinum]|uniref:Uncharacterized protein n=2 Tax=Gossypium TaxID=3633 RepID=A0A5J5RMT8_GOSBA|nr:hypothetical protein ES319_D05G386500v1 [Gossypium barbadense]TYI84869.1 hypothetical protein E1A91_D05G397000v1 [Gossypium mustelinum]